MNPDGSLASSPMFLIQQNGQYVQKSYINEVCTKEGIITAGNSEPGMPGCVTISDLGVFYIPPEASNSIFTNLMFMEGNGLPVTKVFDNKLVIIYSLDD